jgi:diacylglycerol kinase (ATP)
VIDPPPPLVRRHRGFWGSFVHAWEGLVHTLVHQPNMRFHWVSAVLVALVGSGIRLGLAEKVTLIFCVLLVFFAEIVNSAFEAMVDLHTEEFREKARVTKDAGAAAVLVLSIGSAVIFAALLVHNWPVIAASGDQVRRQAVLGVPFAALTAALLGKHRRPAVVDVLVAAAGAALFVLLCLRTTSVVFSVMLASLFVIAVVAAFAGRRR